MPGLSGVVVAKNLDGRLEMVTLALEGARWQQWWRRWEPLEGGWTAWQAFGVPGSGGGFLPAIAQNYDGRLEAAAVGEAKAVWHTWQRHPGRAWTEWQSLGAPADAYTLDYGPVLARNRDGRLELFICGRRLDSWLTGVWHCWQTAAGTDSWSAWSELGHPPEFGVMELALAQNRDGRLELFAKADNGVFPRVWHIWQTAPETNRWSPWSELKTPDELALGPGLGLSRPAVARTKDGRLELFMRGSDNNLWHCSQPKKGLWSAWSSLGRPADGFDPPYSFTTVVAGAHADGRLVVFVTRPRNPAGLALLEQAAPNGDWLPWRSFSSVLEQTILDSALALDADGRLQLWATMEGTADLYLLWQKSPNGSDWHGFVWSVHPPPASTSSEPPGYEPTPAGGAEAPSG